MSFARQEFEDYLKCGLLEHGFLRVKCDACRHEHLVALDYTAGLDPDVAAYLADIAWRVVADCEARQEAIRSVTRQPLY